MHVHEDERRQLIEFGSGTFKVCKVIRVNDGRLGIGDHFHRNKDEAFLLYAGHANRVIVGEDCWENIPAPFIWHVPRGAYHIFYLQTGSIMVGLASEEFDPADENKLDSQAVTG